MVYVTPSTINLTKLIPTIIANFYFAILMLPQKVKVDTLCSLYLGCVVVFTDSRVHLVVTKTKQILKMWMINCQGSLMSNAETAAKLFLIALACNKIWLELK